MEASARLDKHVIGYACWCGWLPARRAGAFLVLLVRSCPEHVRARRDRTLRRRRLTKANKNKLDDALNEVVGASYAARRLGVASAMDDSISKLKKMSPELAAAVEDLRERRLYIVDAHSSGIGALPKSKKALFYDISIVRG